MKIKEFTIPIYQYDVSLIFSEGNDAEDVRKFLQDFECTHEDLDFVYNNITEGCFNGGETFRNMKKRKFAAVFYLFSDELVRVNIICHEKRHIEDRLMEHIVVEDIEAAAYLAGFLAEKMLS